MRLTENRKAESSDFTPSFYDQASFVKPPKTLPTEDLIKINVGPLLLQCSLKSSSSQPSLDALKISLIFVEGVKLGRRETTNSF